MKRLVILLMLVAAAFAGLVAAADLGIGPLVITHEDEQKIVLRFGSPVSEGATTPGLSLRIPGIDEVRTFDRRWLYLNTEPLPIQTVDGERLVVDNYVVWRIADPLAYHKAFPTGRSEAELRIDRVVRADVREEVAKRDLASILTTARVEIMDRITRESDIALRGFGIEVSDVRINRTELPEGTIQNVYARMRAERERLARQKRAEGEEEARRIRAEADREARVTVAEARRDAEILRGEGDAEAARIYADVYGRDPDFFYFVRRLEAYRKTIGAGTTLVLPPSHEFFRLFESSEFPQRGGAAGDVSAGDASEAPAAERAE